MRISKRVGQIVLASMIVVLPAFPVLAANCFSSKVSVLTNNTSTFVMSCGVFGSTATKAESGVTNAGGTTTLRVNFISGLAGTSAQTAGLDQAGNSIANCSINDNIAGGAEKTKVCNAAVRWRGIITY